MSETLIPHEGARTFNLAQHEGLRRVGEEFTAETDFRFLGIRILEDGYGLRIQYRLKDHEVQVVGDEVDDVLNDPDAKDDLFTRWAREVRSSKTLIPDPPPKVVRGSSRPTVTPMSVQVETEEQFAERKAPAKTPATKRAPAKRSVAAKPRRKSAAKP